MRWDLNKKNQNRECESVILNNQQSSLWAAVFGSVSCAVKVQGKSAEQWGLCCRNVAVGFLNVITLQISVLVDLTVLWCQQMNNNHVSEWMLFNENKLQQEMLIALAVTSSSSGFAAWEWTVNNEADVFCMWVGHLISDSAKLPFRDVITECKYFDWQLKWLLTINNSTTGFDLMNIERFLT